MRRAPVTSSLRPDDQLANELPTRFCKPGRHRTQSKQATSAHAWRWGLVVMSGSVRFGRQIKEGGEGALAARNVSGRVAVQVAHAAVHARVGEQHA
jgi:hypothetical protein